MKITLSIVLMTLAFSIATCSLQAKGKKITIVVQGEGATEVNTEKTVDVSDPAVWNQLVEDETRLFITTYGKEVGKHLDDVKETVNLLSETWKVTDSEEKDMYKRDLYRDLIAGFKQEGYMEYTAKEKAEMEEPAKPDSKSGLWDY